MKTLVVLSALVSIALAAPTQPDKNLGDAVKVYQDHWVLPGQMKRGKKSAELPSDINEHAMPATEAHTDDDTSTITGRNSLKKPLIVKKKPDYRLYRDSGEDKSYADYKEKCGRHLKVKLCDEDGKFREMLQQSAQEYKKVRLFEEQMQDSIKKAKEAVDNLERDLIEVEKDSEDNEAVKKVDKSKSEQNLHGDIDVAKKMLKYLQEHFGNFTSQSVTSRESESTHTDHFLSAKSAEEKMAQWKHAMSNIQENIEIATNIEDSFTNSGLPERLLIVDQIDTTKRSQGLDNNADLHITMNDHHRRDAQNMHTDDHKRSLSDKTTPEHLDDEHNRREQQVEDDMKPSASENIEIKSTNIENHHSFKSENQKRDKSAMEDNSDFHDTVTEGITKQDILAQSSMSELSVAKSKELMNNQPFTKPKPDVEIKEDMDATKNKDVKIKSIEAVTEHPHSKLTHAETQLNKKMESVSKSSEKTYPQDMHNDIEHNENLMDTADHIEQKQVKHLSDHKSTLAKMKSSEDHFHASTFHQFDEHHKDFVKSAGPVHREADNIKHIDYNDTEREQSKMKSSEDHVHLTNLFHTDKRQENFMKAADNVNQVHDKNHNVLCNDTDHEETLTKLKSPENSPVKSLHQASAEQNKDKKMELTSTKMKSVGDIEFNKLRKINDDNQIAMREVHDTHQEPTKQQSVHFEADHMAQSPEMKSAEEPWRHHLSSMKSSEEHVHHHSHQHSHHSGSHHSSHDEHWAPEHRHFALLKAAEEFKQNMHRHDHNNHSPLREDHHMKSKMRGMHDVDLLEHAPANSHAAGRHHHNMQTHSNRHDLKNIDGNNMQSNFRVSMREAMDGLESDHIFRWQPSHDVPRTAYGGGGGSSPSSSGGAVGVFPNANTGGCGIPLLLSCSPSVVSGSLAKPHSPATPSYSAPSYRTEDNFAFHSKRDVKQISDGLSTNTLQVSAKQKTGKMIENKT